MRRLGYAGGRQTLQRWIAEHRSQPATRPARKWLPQALATTPSPATPNRAAALPSPKQLARLLVQPPAALPPFSAAAVKQVEQDEEAALVASLARRFAALVRACGAGQATRPAAAPADLAPIWPSRSGLANLAAWLAEARACGVSAVKTAATGLEQDGDAVHAALTLPWSNGQVGGQVNRLTLLKRQSYSQASFDLLRRRVLMAA